MWTGSNADGTATAENCAGWTSSGGGTNRGTRGKPDLSDTSWITGSTAFGTNSLRLYCLSN